MSREQKLEHLVRDLLLCVEHRSCAGCRYWNHGNGCQGRFGERAKELRL